MVKFTANPVVALDLIGPSATYRLEIGTAIESLTISHPYEDKVVSGTVVAISLCDRPGKANGGHIFDGIPTRMYGDDHIAGIHNAAHYFIGDQIAIEDADGKIHVIAADKIKAISGSVTSPDGSVMTAVATADEIIAAAAVGGTVIIAENVDAPTAVNITIDTDVQLNGKEITVTEDTDGSGVFKVTGGTMTIGGEGVVNGVGKNDYNMALWATDNGKIIINGGMFINEGATANVDPAHFDLIYASGNGQIEINGGEFKCQTPAWTLNIKDKDRATAKIVVKGGTFYGFDPSNSAAEGPGTNFVADGYKVVEETTGVFTVVVDENYVPPVEAPAAQ